MRFFFFIFKEGVAGIFRSKTTALLTILSLSLVLLLLIFYYLVSQNILQKVSELKSRVTIEVFLEPGLSPAEIAEIRQKLQNTAGVDSIKYISKEAALAKFKELFSGDYDKLIDENPLPESFQIKLASGENRDQTQNTIAEIQIVDGVDEVVYHRKLLTTLNQYFNSMRRIFIAVGAGLMVLSFILLWINIKLTLKTKERIMETMRLVGAQRVLIIGPYFMQAAVEGLFSALLALSAAFLIFYFARLGDLLPFAIDLAAAKWVVIIAVLFAILTCFFATRRQE